jgi:histone H3/H4
MEMAKKVAKKAKACAAKEMLLVASKVKAAIRAKKCMCSSELLPALNEKVYCLIEKAICRTQANKRSTVKPQDV